MDLTCEIPRVPPHEFPDPRLDVAQKPGEQSVVLGGGCFWCVEAVYKEMDGVLSVRSGYAGGTAETADYDSVCTGRTDHAEVIEVRFDPARVSLGQILKVFFSVAHDPTQLNRQGPDTGTQYRSAIFYTSDAQKKVAESYIAQLNKTSAFPRPIVTRVDPLKGIYEAEGYHQDYVEKTGEVCHTSNPWPKIFGAAVR